MPFRRQASSWRLCGPHVVPPVRLIVACASSAPNVHVPFGAYGRRPSWLQLCYNLRPPPVDARAASESNRHQHHHQQLASVCTRADTRRTSATTSASHARHCVATKKSPVGVQRAHQDLHFWAKLNELVYHHTRPLVARLLAIRFASLSQHPSIHLFLIASLHTSAIRMPQFVHCFVCFSAFNFCILPGHRAEALWPASSFSL